MSEGNLLRMERRKKYASSKTSELLITAEELDFRCHTTYYHKEEVAEKVDGKEKDAQLKKANLP